jgi:hypothetical protein
LFIIMVCLVPMSCSKDLTPEQLASMAARGYYQHLASGEYEQFLEGKAGMSDDSPQLYREQLLTAYKQFVAQQQRDHQGIQDVQITSVKTDSLLPYTNVFLTLCFGDSTSEEIVVPMVEIEGKWRMK